MQPTSKQILSGIFWVLSALFLTLFIVSAWGGVTDPFSATLASGFAFSSMDWEGGDNIGGFTSEAFLGLYHEIDQWPNLAQNPASDAELVTLQGSYAMKDSKKFIRVYTTPRTFGGESENQGEIDGKSFLQKGEFFYPGSREESLAFARKINNARGVLIGIDPNTGKRIQFGSKEFPCHFKPKLSFGAQPTDRRGLTVEFEADNFLPAVFYPGVIPLSDADMPAQS